MGLNLNGKQIILILIAVLSVLSGSTAQLTNLFGDTIASAIISASSLGTAILSGILTAVMGQGSQVKDVLAMDGVERLRVNAKANPTLAALAFDPKVDKISPTDNDRDAVQKTAEAAVPKLKLVSSAA